MTILDRIIDHKREEVAERKRGVPLSAHLDAARYHRATVSFRDALVRDDRFHFISEIKKASPSKGIIQPDFDPVRQARLYRDGGASAISVLTDEKFFMGRLDHLSAVRDAVDLPILRKDFIIDPYQIHEARAAGADMILLIARVLATSQVDEYAHCAAGLGLDVLLEIAAADDIVKIPRRERLMVGINNRDLADFSVDLTRTVSLKRLLPDDAIVISESGIAGAVDCRMLKKNGVRGALVGETFMRSGDPATLLRQIIREVNDEDAP